MCALSYNKGNTFLRKKLMVINAVYYYYPVISKGTGLKAANIKPQLYLKIICMWGKARKIQQNSDICLSP